MKRSVKAVVVGAAAALLAAGAMSSAFAGGGEGEGDSDREVRLLGEWSGHRERIASTDGYRRGTATLVVTEQRGWTFKGVVRWSTPEGEQQDPMVGAFTPGAEVMSGADDEGTYSFKLLDRRTLDYCYVEHGTGYRTTCARLVKVD